MFTLNWALMAVSLFNTILLTWLGLTVLLNADQRRYGIWVAGGGLLLGGAFFVSHSAILGLGLTYLGPGMQFWLRVGLFPALVLPFAWYVVMLWYNGYWEGERTRFHRRHRRWLVIMTASIVLGLVGLGLLANPLFEIIPLIPLKQFLISYALGGIPILAIGFPCYIALCMLLSLDALRRPGPSRRVMGQLARERARPWMIANSVLLLLVGILVGWIVMWGIFSARILVTYRVTPAMINTILYADLVISSLIAASTICLGQAIVSYEVFTGKTLPRRGLWRHWQRIILLAGGFGVVVGWALTIQLRPIYILVMTTVLMTAFVALISWRSFTERESFMGSLRPFVASQQLYDQLLTTATSTDAPTDVFRPFQALCEDVLGAKVAYLVPLGSLGPLVGQPLSHPPNQPLPSALLNDLGEVTSRFTSPSTMSVALDPAGYGGAVWAVPLWSERGLIGLLLLGEKWDNGLYTQEEIEIARASGERLIDTQASTEMARRLMRLQRTRLAESRVIDQQTRRTLHDDILPLLHTAMLSLGGLNGQTEEAVTLLTDAHHQISDLLRQMPMSVAPEVGKVGLIRALQRTVSSDMAGAFDDVTWQIDPDTEAKIRRIPALTAEVIYYAGREAVRNAARYGRDATQKKPFILSIEADWYKGLTLIVQDNGVGLGTEQVASQGSGQGLALHSTMLAVVGGELTVESSPGRYTRILITLPQEALETSLPTML